jgi:hypothetical protein
MSQTQNQNSRDYWKTKQGINERITMFANAFLVASFNFTLQQQAELYQQSIGRIYLQLTGPPPKCPYCRQYYGKVYRVGELTPEFPAHPYCPHVWDVVVM